MQFELRMETAEFGLNAVGNVYRSPRSRNPIPLVTDVFVARAHQSRFCLDGPGRYVFFFNVAGGRPAFELKLFRDSPVEELVASKEFAAEDGKTALSFVFRVNAD